MSEPVPTEALAAMEQAFLIQMRAAHPDLHWEIVDDPSDPNLATPHNPNPVSDRGPLAA